MPSLPPPPSPPPSPPRRPFVPVAAISEDRAAASVAAALAATARVRAREEEGEAPASRSHEVGSSAQELAASASFALHYVERALARPAAEPLQLAGDRVVLPGHFSRGFKAHTHKHPSYKFT